MAYEKGPGSMEEISKVLPENRKVLNLPETQYKLCSCNLEGLLET